MLSRSGQSSNAASLNSGQYVTIQGKCDGMGFAEHRSQELRDHGSLINAALKLDDLVARRRLRWVTNRIPQSNLTISFSPDDFTNKEPRNE